jgi:lantibiotic modifying enzyme
MRTDPNAPFLHAAAAIGGRLCRDAIWHGARCNWVGDGLEPSGGQWLPVRRALGPALYDGAAGIGLFLAELYAATGEAPFRTAARGALALAVTRRGDVNPAARVALHTGLAGIAWAVARAGAAMDDAELREAAAGSRRSWPACSPRRGRWT